MSRFNYDQYQANQERLEKADAAKASGASNSVKIGFFKLANDKDEALVRINCSSPTALDFASVHTISSNGKWMRVSCLNHIGSYVNECPLCTAAAAADDSGPISIAKKRVYVQMLVSYLDKATGTWSAAVPVIWERPAGFARELATYLADYGDLRKQPFKVIRQGVARDMHTTYQLMPILPQNPLYSQVPEDFSAFDGFNIAKHSYWEKTKDEIDEFLSTGAFPEYVKESAAKASDSAAPVVPAKAGASVAYASTGYAESQAQAQPTPIVVAAEGQAQPMPAAVAETPKEDKPAEQPQTRFGTSRFSF